MVRLHPDINCAEDLLGWDFEWLACDADGHVGLFTTAGGGFMRSLLSRVQYAHLNFATATTISAESLPDL